jgi:2-C-methyl-D-erythritol 2,4-cyclodiphosphate synthase
VRSRLELPACPPVIRVGIGYDSHRFITGRPLILGGITIPHSHGLAGHSDADAVAHALTDAILGAAGAGDIGRLFPDTDPRWRDADSLELLRSAHDLVRSRGWALRQADLTIIAERPKLGPHLDSMAQGLAGRLGVTAADIGVKAKTNEGMGFIGRGEGIAVIAVATLEAR